MTVAAPAAVTLRRRSRRRSTDSSSRATARRSSACGWRTPSRRTRAGRDHRGKDDAARRRRAQQLVAYFDRPASRRSTCRSRLTGRTFSAECGVRCARFRSARRSATRELARRVEQRRGRASGRRRERPQSDPDHRSVSSSHWQRWIAHRFRWRAGSKAVAPAARRRARRVRHLGVAASELVRQA